MMSLPAHLLDPLCDFGLTPTYGQSCRWGTNSTFWRSIGHLRCRLLALVFPGGRPEPAARPVLVHHVVAPRQVPLPVDQVLHERVRAVSRAALHGDVPAVAELVYVVLDAPMDPRLAHQVGANLRGDDLVGSSAVAVTQDLAVEVDNHPLAHGVKVAVATAHAHIRGDHEVLERVRLVREAPRITNRRGVPGGSNHNLRALVRALASHLGEHAIVADYERELAPLRPVAHRDADVAGLPRLHGYPRVELAIIQNNLPGFVDDQPCVVRISLRVVLHDGEATPNLVLDTRRPERGHLGSVQPAHDIRVGTHRQAVQRVLREDHQVHRAEVTTGLAHHLDDSVRLRREVRLRRDHRELKLDAANDDAVGRLVEASESTGTHRVKQRVRR
mmetsp:Transcript_55410/g.149412  ORF Transcript_55410/g.149412 Transcript_55410/m.149412 type:complete len:387 (+) Transcript_55410:415-1575(+)